MKTIFIGGSRHISQLPAEVKQRLDNIVRNGHQVIVGDANGADRAVQQHLFDAGYARVTVFCAGPRPRNNVGHWNIRSIDARHVKGFEFYAAKDRAMARQADVGLMIWDGKSPGTILNVLRLTGDGKASVLFDLPGRRVLNIKTPAEWQAFLAGCGDTLLRDLRERANPDEWQLGMATPAPDSGGHPPIRVGE